MTIENALRFALRIISGRIIYNFAFGATAFAERSKRIFTSGGVTGNGRC